MKIVKALNNNMILVWQLGGQELICQGKGIGWHKHAGDEVDESLGVAAKTKDTETKSEGIAYGISAIVAGVTEPAADASKPLINKVIISAPLTGQLVDLGSMPMSTIPSLKSAT